MTRRSRQVSGTRCTAVTSDGTPCKAWAVRGSVPPRCGPHGGAEGEWGAPIGNRNAWVHGMYAAESRTLETIDEVITDLAEKQTMLSEYISSTLSDVDSGVTADRLIRIIELHGRNASRLGRLLRDRRALSGAASDGISAAIAQALEELQTELGTQLVGDD